MMKYIPIIKTHTTAFNIVLVFSQLPVGGWSLEPCGRGITALLEAWLQRVEKVNAEQKQCHFVPFSGGARWWMKLSWTKLGSAQPSQTLLSAAKPKQLCALVPEGALWSGVECSGVADVDSPEAAWHRQSNLEDLSVIDFHCLRFTEGECWVLWHSSFSPLSQEAM